MVSLEDISVVEVTHTAAAPEEGVVTREVGHESAEVLYPRVVVVPEEEIDHLLVALLRDVEWMPSLALVIVEGEDVDRHTQLVFDGRDILDGNRVCDVVEFKLMKKVVVVVRAISILGARTRRES